MLPHDQAQAKEPKRRRRDLLLLLLLPFMCALVFCASNFGLAVTNTDAINVTIEAYASAVYISWLPTEYSPVDPIIGTFVAIDNGDIDGDVALNDARTQIAIQQTSNPDPQDEDSQDSDSEDSQPSELEASETTATPAPTETSEPSETPTESPTPSDTVSPTITPSPSISPTPSITPSSSATPSPTLTLTPTPTSTPTDTPTATLTPTPTPTPTNTDVPPPPVAAFNPNPSFGGAPLSVTFNNSSTGNIVGYSWDFDDGNTSTAASPTHIFASNGWYNVRLTVFGPVSNDTTIGNIFVGNINDPPVNALPGMQFTPLNTALTINGISVSDSDAGNDFIRITVSVNNGTVTLNGTAGLFITGGSSGSSFVIFLGQIPSINTALSGLVYTPNAGFSGTDTLTIDTNDRGNNGFGGAQSDVDGLTILVNPSNTPPVAIDDAYGTTQDTPLNEPPVSGVLSNDTDADLDTLNVTGADTTSVQGGTVSVNADGSFDYTPPAGYFGADTFNYTVDDGNGGSDTGLVTITVNASPVAVDDAYGTTQDTPLNVPASGVLGNDTDPNLDPLSVTGADTNSVQGGSVSVNADGSFDYTPPAGYTGADSFTYTIDDGNGGSDSATVNITVNLVNTPPVAADDAYATNQDAPLNVPANGVLGNDTDADLNPLSVTGADTNSVQGGTVAVNADGSFDYTPPGGYTGADSFTYTIGDGNGGSDSATVDITISFVNTPPVAVDDAYATNQDAPLNVPANGVLGNDSDADSHPLSVTGADTNSVQGGTVAVNADGSFDYTPPAGYFGVDIFDYTVGDGNGGSDSATVNIAVNALPVAVDDAYATNQGTPLNVPANGVLGNDTDADLNPLNVTGADATSTQGGAVSVNADGSFSYTPPGGYFGADSFTYTIGDGNGGSDSATVNITVNFVNTPPVALDDAYVTDEDTPLNVPANGVLGNDSDADLDPLNVTGADTNSAQGGTVSVNADGSFSYTPPGGYFGADSFNYTIGDGNGGSDSATVNITVNFVNTPPVALDDAYATNQDTPLNVPANGVLGNDTDADSHPLNVIGADVTSAQGGAVTVNADGSFSYTPPGGYFGADSFTYTIGDGNGGSDSATVNITVNFVNTPPVAVDDAYATNQDTPLNVPANGVLGNDTDADLDPLNVTGADTNSAQGGTVSVNADGSFSYTPPGGYFGADSFTYTIGDGNGGSDSATVNITVNFVNTPPVAVDDAYATNQDTPLNVPANGVLGNDTDADSHPLSVTGADTTSAQGGSVTVNADGSFSYTPPAAYVGGDSFNYTIGDGNGGADSATVTIIVNP